MKKIIICLIGAIILSNCEISPKKAQAQIVDSNEREVTVAYKEIDGMKYALFIYGDPRRNGGATMSAVNVTRDKLQTEIITHNLKNLKNGRTSTSE